ncbi:MAG: hypothetical protein M1514_03910 [Patescibacteria group bacterium]|nr:hypothetical protein [Patescibacteria group bacterium]
MFTILKSRFTFKYLLAMLGLGVSLVWLSIFSFPDQKLHLIFCNVGQGDAVLITQGFSQILIDGGPNDLVLDCLSRNVPFFDKTIEVVALTHPEADHLTGLISVFKKYQVKTFVSGPEGSDSGTYQALLTVIKKQINNASASQNLKIINIYTGEKIKVGEIQLQALWPEKQWVAERVSGKGEKWELGSGNVLGAKTTNTHLNQFSLIFLLQAKNYQVLLMGDGDSEIQDDVIKENSLMPIDILKFPHHGSKTGMSEEFLQKIKPKEAIISVGKNSYGHPSAEALDLLKKSRVKIRRTDQEGEIQYNF